MYDADILPTAAKKTEMPVASGGPGSSTPPVRLLLGVAENDGPGENDGQRSLLFARADEICGLLKVLANEHRFRILCALSEKEQTVGELGSRIGVSQPALSQHLMRLRDMNVVTTCRSGTYVYYSFESNHIVEDMLSGMQSIFSH
jgi:DNA-binding transcriptional ArsR family regulator